MKYMLVAVLSLMVMVGCGGGTPSSSSPGPESAKRPSSSAPSTLARKYKFTPLAPLPGGSDSQALSINSSGVVAGYSTINGLPEATKWVGGHAIDLGPGYALSINDNGELAGIVVGPSGTNEAAHWLRDSGVSITIGLLDGFDSIVANSIDTDGALTGTAFNSFNFDEMEAYKWTAQGGIVAVPQLIESFAIRNGIMVGLAPNFQAATSVVPDLGVSGDAAAINSKGDVVGGTFGNVNQAFLWKQGQLTLLGTDGALGGGLLSINSSDLAVGNLEEPLPRVRLQRLHPRVDSHPVGIAAGWSQADGFVRLASRIQSIGSWSLANANSINDSGLIAGTATMTSKDGAFITTGFVLEPK